MLCLLAGRDDVWATRPLCDKCIGQQTIGNTWAMAFGQIGNTSQEVCVT